MRPPAPVRDDRRRSLHARRRCPLSGVGAIARRRRVRRRLVAPAVAASAVLFMAGLAFAWWALVPAALRFLVNYGADVVEPIWSIERYLDFVLLLMVATGLAFELPELQLLLGAFGLVGSRTMLGAWRWVVP